MNAFEKRLEYIAKYHPELAKRLEDAPLNSVALEDAEGSFLNLSSKASISIHILGIPPINKVNTLLEWLDEHPFVFLIFHEPDLGILKGFLQNDVSEKLLKHPRILIESFTDDELKGYYGRALTISTINRRQSAYPPSFLTSKYYSGKQEIASNFKHLLYHAIGNYKGEAEDIYPFNTGVNEAVNLLQVPTGYHAKALKGKFSDVPLVFCGGAPSIIESKEFLKSVENKALIVTGSTGINALQELGIKPHFLVCLDPNKNLFSKFADYYEFEVPLFFSSRTSYELMQYYSAPFVYLFCDNKTPLSSYKKSLDIGLDYAKFDDGYTFGISVSSFSAVLARWLGCPEVYLVGVDFAYQEGNKRYSVSNPQHPVVKQDVKSDMPKMPTYPVKRSGNEDMYNVTYEFQREIRWFGTYSARFKSPKISIASEIGAEVSGIPKVVFEEKINSWKDRGDLHKRLECELLNATTEWVSESGIREYFKERNSEIEYLIDLLRGLLVNLKQLPLESNHLKKVLLRTEIVRRMQIFLKSDIYLNNLSVVAISVFDALKAKQRFWARSHDSDVDELSFQLVQRYLQFLIKNWICLSRTLFQLCKERSVARLGLRESEISDERVRIYHRNGSLKREINFKDGVKEGREVCFAADGTLLLEADFVNNEVVGTPFYRGLYD